MAYDLQARVTTDMAFEAALKSAQMRSYHSYFDQHVIEDDDGGYFTIDEGDYNALPMKLIDRIAYTVPGGLADDY